MIGVALVVILSFILMTIVPFGYIYLSYSFSNHLRKSFKSKLLVLSFPLFIITPVSIFSYSWYIFMNSCNSNGTFIYEPQNDEIIGIYVNPDRSYREVSHRFWTISPINNLLSQRLIDFADFYQKARRFHESRINRTYNSDDYKLTLENFPAKYEFRFEITQPNQYIPWLYETRQKIQLRSNHQVIAESIETSFGGGFLGLYIQILLQIESNALGCGYVNNEIGAWRPQVVSDERYKLYRIADSSLFQKTFPRQNAN